MDNRSTVGKIARDLTDKIYNAICDEFMHRPEDKRYPGLVTAYDVELECLMDAVMLEFCREYKKDRNN